jgi:hypothetical protein
VPSSSFSSRASDEEDFFRVGQVNRSKHIHFKGHTPPALTMNTKVLASKFTNCAIRLDTRTILTIYYFLDRVRKFNTEILESSS